MSRRARDKTHRKAEGKPVAFARDGADRCPHRPPCPGCPRFGDLQPAQTATEQLSTLAREHGLTGPVIHAGSGLGERHRARLAVRGRARSPKIGLFEAGSHRIVDTPHCSIHHPSINEAVAHLKSTIRETGIAPYSDATHRGALRYVQIVVERTSGRVQIVLVGNGRTSDVLGNLPERLSRRLGERLQGLFFNAQPERNNTILGPTTVQLAGESAIRQRLGGVDVFFPPDSFGQSALPMYERALARIAELVPPDVTLTEGYCGVGSIGLGLLGRVRSLRFNERSPHGIAGLERGLAARPALERARARVIPGPAEDALDAFMDAEIVILDPPRKGLDARLLEQLAAHPPRRLIYLACGLPALLDELPHLERPGGLVLQGVEAFDFFPFTEHVETLVWLDRASD